jgi:TfoX/Sxy family transcriptional regulator of competence genes
MATKKQTDKSASAVKGARKWKQASAELVQLFENEVARLGVAEVKKMFGYPAGFVNGNMFAAVFEDRVIFRLGPQELESFVQNGHGQPFEPTPGRIMREYVASLPEFPHDHELLRSWLEQALAHTSRLEPKSAALKPRAKRSRKKPT